MHSLRRRDQSRCALERAVRRERQPKRIEIVGLARCQASNIGHGRLATRYSLLATSKRHGFGGRLHGRARLNTFPAITALSTLYRGLDNLSQTGSASNSFLPPDRAHPGTDQPIAAHQNDRRDMVARRLLHQSRQAEKVFQICVRIDTDCAHSRSRSIRDCAHVICAEFAPGKFSFAPQR